MRESSQNTVGDEWQTRRGIWMMDARLVRERNALGDFQLGLNQLVALTPAGCRVLLGFRADVGEVQGMKPRFQSAGSLGGCENCAVTGVGDQGACRVAVLSGSLLVPRAGASLRTGC